MNIQSKYVGEIDIEEQDIFSFEKGLPAFESETQFVLLPFGQDQVFQILQSVKSPEVAFVVASPFSLFQDYQVKLPESLQEQLMIQKEDDVAIFTILTLKEPFKDTTANLQAPVIFNVKEKKGKQLLLNDSPYERKHRIFPKELAEEGQR